MVRNELQFVSVARQIIRRPKVGAEGEHHIAHLCRCDVVVQLCGFDEFLKAHTERDNGDVAWSVDPNLSWCSAVGDHRIDERVDGQCKPSD